MALIGQSASLLFKIDADASGAQRELRAVDAAVGRLGGQFSSFAGIASVGAAGIAAIGTAAVTASVAMFNLAKSTSEYGSEIFDATQKTGLGAEAISSLKIAAEQSGSSLEAVTRGITIFAKNYKGTSQDLEGELGKLFQKINDAKPGFEQLTLATKSFGRAGGDLIPVIKSFDGNLPGLIDKLRKLGVTMTDEDARAADEFGDTLDMLSTQAAAVGRQFATEMMPMMTGAMHAISQAMANNKGVAAQWGQSLVNVVNGVSFTFGTAGKAINDILRVISVGLINNQNQWAVWGHAVRIAAMIATAGLSEVAWVMDKIGIATGGASNSGQGQWLGPSAMAVPPSISIPKMPGRGGGRGGGGGGGGAARDPAAEAERLRREAVQAAKSEMQDTLAIYAAGYAERLALLDFNLANKYTSELNYIRDVGRIHLEALEDEKRLNAELLKNENLNLEEKKDIANKIKVLEIEIRTEKQKTATEVLKQIKKEDEAAEEAHQKELKRLQDISNKRQQAFNQMLRERQERLKQEREQRFDIPGTWQDFKDSVMRDGPTIGETLTKMGNVGWTAFNQIADGIGSMVQAWVLYGTAGPNAMKKMVASVLAGVAAQSAVLAIFELAKGFAALFWNPPEAAAHFMAAALFGSLAVGTAIAGRAIAGDSFSQQASGASAGGGSGQGASQPAPLNFTSPFAGFQDRANVVLGGVADALDRFNEKFGMASPGHVVMAGAGEAAPAIFGAYQDVLRDDPKAATTQRRNQGDYRS